MEKYFGLVLGVLALVVVAGGIVSLGTMFKTSIDNIDNLHHDGVFKIVVKRANGDTENIGVFHNTFTQYGMNITRDALQGTSVNVSQLALGNGTTPTATDTALPGIHTTGGLGIANGDFTNNIGDGNWTVNKTWTATADNMVCNVTGLYVQGGNMFAGTTFTSTTLQTDDQISVSYTTTVS
ncbi:MAG: hypothetical protein DRP42_05255 [Tenericutes bacterium]|nr:MAG: hypothetical protein DRP42_05255 [Mycoplasmatota bacterium]